MNNKKFTFSVFLFLHSMLLFSQLPVGLKFDLNGEALNGYADPLTYAPDKKLSVVHNSESYELGYYYDSLGTKISGQIKFEDKRIWFSSGSGNSGEIIEPNEINSFVIGTDSFFVATNFYYKNKIKEEPEFVQFISEVNDNVFAKHYHFSSSLGQQYAMQPPIIETILVKHKDSTIWVNFPDNSRFKKNALEYFGQIPYLNERISTGTYWYDDIMSIIKMAEYYQKYQDSQLIYFDTYWQEVRQIERARYSAKIENIVDSIWTFSYYEDAVKLYTAHYSAFYPNNKNGAFISYYSKGGIREIIEYVNNKPKDVKLFDEAGKLSSNYQYIEKKVPASGEKETILKYISVIDSAGNNILESPEIINHEIYDSFANVLYHHQFFNHELISSYSLVKGDTVFQITNTENNFKLKSLQKKLANFMYEKQYNKALSENAQGIVMASLLINKKGYVVQYSLLNSIHPQIDKLVNDFILNTLKLNNEGQLKFKPFKHDKVKQYCEVVIPFDFSSNRFYREPVNYNSFYYMNWHMQQQMQWQMQQNMMNNMHAPVPTTIPIRF